MMLISFFDVKGILHKAFVPLGQTANQAFLLGSPAVFVRQVFLSFPFHHFLFSILSLLTSFMLDLCLSTFLNFTFIASYFYLLHHHFFPFSFLLSLSPLSDNFHCPYFFFLYPIIIFFSIQTFLLSFPSFLYFPFHLLILLIIIHYLFLSTQSCIFYHHFFFFSFNFYWF
ncbi:unnamed protein product [Acanthosepion pharaonis]|uniref:Uncharacterized protein n=1 Tax=Acanthosepion pharaonis TaxID=158019 RepID=A0A812E8L6_ACAPH|nr:unnamed protein product [Sepia pharaonis]